MNAALGRCCGLCVHFAQHPQILDMGQCSHSPPVPVLVNGGVTSMFPMVAKVHACGQFEAAGAANDQDAGQGESRLLTS